MSAYKLRIMTITAMVNLLFALGVIASPAAELKAAVVDLQTNVRPTAWASTRYISQYNADEKNWKRNEAVLSFVLNSVSQSATIIKPTKIPGSRGRLFRIDLKAYGLTSKNWETLVSDTEPYWHITTDVIDPQTGKKRTVLTDGGWIDLAVAKKLRSMSHSAGAVLRLDWLIIKLSTPPHYYQFAKVSESLAGFYKSLGIDKKTVIKLKANRGANLFYSGVTRKVRRLSRWQGPLGGVWQTYDSFDSKAKNDPIRNPTFSVNYDASEHIAAKANGLHLFALYNNKGQRQDSVPDRIAKDDSDPHGDGILLPMISCVRCHVEDGLRPFKNDQAKLMNANVKLLAKDPQVLDQLISFYLSPKLKRDFNRDREDYTAAVKTATGGFSGKQNAAALADLFRSYQYQQVTLRIAAAELGIKPTAIQRMAALKNSRDPILLALITGLKVQRQQWEGSYAEAALLVASFQVNQPKIIIPKVKKN